MEDMAKVQLLVLLSKIDAASKGATIASSNEVRAALLPAQAAAGAQNGVFEVDNASWQNYQGNLGEKQVERQYVVMNLPHNLWSDGVNAVRTVVQAAEAAGRSLRSVGSAWSSSPVSQTPYYLIHCAPLSGWGPEITAADLAPGVDPALIAHFQAGTTIQTINEMLEANGQTLPVMGGNAGQNIAGAVATGTHGSWIDKHALADYVHAIALVGAGGKAYWIEPASRPLTNAGFKAWGVFEVVRDDQLFAAAQVSLGALGVVTSVVLDVEPRHWIRFSRTQVPFNKAVEDALYDMNLSELCPEGRPAHFEVVLNPYQLDGVAKGAFVEKGYQVPPVPSKAVFVNPHQSEISAHFSFADMAWDAVAKLLSEFPAMVPPVLDLVMPHVFAEVKPHTAPLSEVWHVSTGGPPLISTELAVAQSDVKRTLGLLLKLLDLKKGTFYWPGVFGIRFGNKTGALLGFTRYDKWCTMELVYLRGVAGVQEFLSFFYDSLRAEQIGFAVHLGQVNFLDKEKVQATYGEAALAQWDAARQRLGATGQTFANDATNAWGLTAPIGTRS